ncbi:unnamed protein product [Allacma fusca]|uniref:Uncharacterized protein n=1 Tax=Allacma fusca TaxID=39272 RepID=A0A8J2KAK3_9HEXA|nr:unnamed protein product [Allacma fusca]
MQPSIVGLLTTMPDVMNQRSHMRHVIENNTVFVKSSPDDFGMSVSPDAQSLSLNLTHVTQQKMIALVASIQGKIQSKYAELITNTSLNTVGSAINKFQGLRKIPETIQDLASREGFFNQLTTELRKLDEHLFVCEFQELKNLNQNLQLFEGITEQQVPFGGTDWIRPLQASIQVTGIQLDRKITELNMEFTKVMSDIAAQLANNFSKTLAEPDQLQVSFENKLKAKEESCRTGKNAELNDCVEKGRQREACDRRLDDYSTTLRLLEEKWTSKIRTFNATCLKRLDPSQHCAELRKKVNAFIQMALDSEKDTYTSAKSRCILFLTVVHASTQINGVIKKALGLLKSIFPAWETYLTKIFGD